MPVAGSPDRDPKGRSPTTIARFAADVTARQSGMRVVDSHRDRGLEAVDVVARRVADEEHGMPASSKISAEYMSYAVSIAHFSPLAFHCIR